MNIRCICNDSDIAAVAAVFTMLVHELGASYYDATQRNAWAARLSGLRILLAIEKSAIVGFICYEPNGHIEFFYTAPGFERQGVASALYREVEKALPGVSLFTEAGLVAKPFFMQHGFTVVEWVDVVLLKLARCLDTQNTELLSKEL